MAMNKNIRQKGILFFSSGFLTGYSPVASGTVGTLAGIAVYLVLSLLPIPLYIIATIVLTGAAVWLSAEAARIYGHKDPSEVVIDEIVGYLCAMATFAPDWRLIVAGFFVFRFFDVVKPFPANRINDRVSGGTGIVFDDIVAGIYTNVCLQVLRMMMHW